MNGKLDVFKLDGLKLDGPAGKSVKSVQSGTAQITSGSSVTVNIASVIPANAIVEIYLINAASSGQYDCVAYQANSLSANSFTVYRYASTGTTTFGWRVIEYENVKSKQQGSFTSVFSSTQTATIASVNYNKSIVSVSNISSSTSGPGSAPDYFKIGRLTGDTSLTINYSGTIQAGNSISWQVLEFN